MTKPKSIKMNASQRLILEFLALIIIAALLSTAAANEVYDKLRVSGLSPDEAGDEIISYIILHTLFWVGGYYVVKTIGRSIFKKKDEE